MNRLRRAAWRALLPVALAALAVLGLTGRPAEAARQGDSLGAVAQWSMDALRRGDGAAYADLRRQVVTEVARRAEVDPAALEAQWAAADPRRMIVALSAIAQVGTPYRSSTSQPGVGFDCSGLTLYAWSQVGVALPHQSRSQIGMLPSVDPAVAQPGDVLWYPGHVMLALGGGAMIDAANHRIDVAVRHVPGRSLRAGDPLGLAPPLPAPAPPAPVAAAAAPSALTASASTAAPPTEAPVRAGFVTPDRLEARLAG